MSETSIVKACLKAAKSGADPHAMRRLTIRLVSELIDIANAKQHGVIVTNELVDTIIRYFMDQVPELEWELERLQIYNTVDTYCMMLYDSLAAELYMGTRKTLTDFKKGNPKH